MANYYSQWITIVIILSKWLFFLLELSECTDDWSIDHHLYLGLGIVLSIASISPFRHHSETVSNVSWWSFLIGNSHTVLSGVTPWYIRSLKNFRYYNAHKKQYSNSYTLIIYRFAQTIIRYNSYLVEQFCIVLLTVTVI